MDGNNGTGRKCGRFCGIYVVYMLSQLDILELEIFLVILQVFLYKRILRDWRNMDEGKSDDRSFFTQFSEIFVQINLIESKIWDENRMKKIYF